MPDPVIVQVLQRLKNELGESISVLNPEEQHKDL
jgi:hypothetical protein